MPTYEYHCKDCDLEVEEFQSIVAKPLEVCPRCGGRVERAISGGAGLIFKGSGFYLTDYKRSGDKSNGKEGSKESKKEESKTTPKSTKDD
jgi:putative FmdB family regulatory protein